MPQQPDDQPDPRDERPGPVVPNDSAAIDRAFAELVAGFHDSPDGSGQPGSPSSPDVIGNLPGTDIPEDIDKPDNLNQPDSLNQPDNMDQPAAGRDWTGRLRRWGPTYPEWRRPHRRGTGADRSASDTGDTSHEAAAPSSGGDAGNQAPAAWRSPTGSAPSADDPDAWDLDDDADPDEGTPEPPPWPRLSVPALLGWLGIFLAVATMIVAAVGIPLPYWAGWLAVAAFAGGFGLLISRLPGKRPPDAGDGARV